MNFKIIIFLLFVSTLQIPYKDKIEEMTEIEYKVGQNLFQQTNQHRSRRGYKKLQWSDKAFDVCSSHNLVMQSKKEETTSGFHQRCRSIQNAEVCYQNVARVVETTQVDKVVFQKWKSSQISLGTLQSDANFGAVAALLDKSDNSWYVCQFMFKKKRQN